jgi:hypothetical protein
MAKEDTSAFRRSPYLGKRAKLGDYAFEEHYGVSRLTEDIALPDKYWWTLRNAYVTKNNFIQQRNGYTKITASSIGATTKIRKMFEYESNAGAKTLIARAGTAWYRLSGDTLISLDGSRTNDVYGQAAQYNGKLYMADGGTLRQMTAAYVVTIPSASQPSTVSCVHTHNHRLIVNDDANPLQTACSKVDELDFSTAVDDAIILDLSLSIPGGDKIIGYSTFLENFLVIWMKRHIAIYYLPTTFNDIALQQIIDVSVLSYDGIVAVGNDLYFPSDSGYKSLIASVGTRNVMDLNDVSKHLDPYYRQMIGTLSDARDINAVFYPKLNHVYFTLPFTNSPEWWVISKDLESATGGKGNIGGGPYTGMTAYSFCLLKNGYLYFGGSDGHIYRFNNGTNDNGAAIYFDARKTGMYFKNPKLNKAPKEFEAFLKATNDLVATLYHDFGITGSTDIVTTEDITIETVSSLWDEAEWDVAEWDADGQKLVNTRNLLGRGKILNLGLRHNTKDALLSFPYWIISLYLEGDKS